VTGCSVTIKNGPQGPFSLRLLKSRSAALMAAFARVFLVIGGYAALQAALLAFRGGKANPFWGDGAGGGFALGFGTEFFGHDRGSSRLVKADDYRC